MNEYHIKVKAARIVDAHYTLSDGRTVEATAFPRGSYHVEFPDGEAAVIPDAEFEAHYLPVD